MKAKIKTDDLVPRVLIADDDPCVVRAVADRCTQMGFNVETASNGLQALIKASEHQPDILVIDVHLPEVDGLSVLGYLSEAARKASNVVVITGRPGEDIVAQCDGFDARCIRKGPLFWHEFETRLVEIYPNRAIAIRRSVDRSAPMEVKESPRVLLVDDDVSIKRIFRYRIEKLGATLLYASDTTRGYWKARREQPTVIVADYYLPDGDAEQLLNRLRHTPETGSIPVIVQTGGRLSDFVKQRLGQQIGDQPGAARILRKSLDGQELFEVLQRYCGFAGSLDGESLYH